MRNGLRSEGGTRDLGWMVDKRDLRRGLVREVGDLRLMLAILDWGKRAGSNRYDRMQSRIDRNSV